MSLKLRTTVEERAGIARIAEERPLDRDVGGVGDYVLDAMLDLKDTLAEIERLEHERHVCPCQFVEPCRSSCTCATPSLSGGCERCIRYGSPEQRLAMAQDIVAKERRYQALADFMRKES